LHHRTVRNQAKVQPICDQGNTMSDSLIRAVGAKTQPLLEAYSSFEKECSQVAKLIKILFTEGLQAAWNECNNSSEYEAVNDLMLGTSIPKDGSISEDGEWAKTDFKSEKASYRIIDTNYHPLTLPISEPNPEKGMYHEFVLERFEEDGTITRLGEPMTGSLFSFAFRQRNPLNEISMNVIYPKHDSDIESEDTNNSIKQENEVARLKLLEKFEDAPSLQKFGDAHLMKIDNFMLIKKSNNEVQIENLNDGFKITVDDITAKNFTDLINETYEKFGEVSIASLMNLIDSVSQFVESLVTPEEMAFALFGDTSLSTATQQNKDLAALHFMYADFTATSNSHGIYDAEDRIDACVNYLNNNPKQLKALQNIFTTDQQAREHKLDMYTTTCRQLSKSNFNMGDEVKGKAFAVLSSAVTTLHAGMVDKAIRTQEVSSLALTTVELFGDTNLSTSTQMDKDLAAIHYIYTKFVEENSEDDYFSSDPAGVCAAYLKNNPEDLEALKIMFPMEKVLSKESTKANLDHVDEIAQERFFKYFDHCKKLAEGADDDRKASAFRMLQSSLRMFIAVLQKLREMPALQELPSSEVDMPTL